MYKLRSEDQNTRFTSKVRTVWRVRVFPLVLSVRVLTKVQTW